MEVSCSYSGVNQGPRGRRSKSSSLLGLLIFCLYQGTRIDFLI